MNEDWSDYEPKDAVEVVGLALIGAGITGPLPEGYEGPGVTMDRQTATEVVEALERNGYLVTGVGLAEATPATVAGEGLDEAWKAAEEAVRKDRGWFIVTSYDRDLRGLYTIEGRRWIDPDPITEPVRIFQRPLIEGLTEFATEYTHLSEAGVERGRFPEEVE